MGQNREYGPKARDVGAFFCTPLVDLSPLRRRRETRPARGGVAGWAAVRFQLQERRGYLEPLELQVGGAPSQGPQPTRRPCVVCV